MRVRWGCLNLQHILNNERYKMCAMNHIREHLVARLTILLNILSLKYVYTSKKFTELMIVG